jgi:MATE family multidrug resistance protein
MLGLSWPMMVLPTAGVMVYQGSLYWAWTFASAYIITLAVVFLFRFRAGKWKTMRVIESATPAIPLPDPDDAVLVAAPPSV